MSMLWHKDVEGEAKQHGASGVIPFKTVKWPRKNRFGRYRNLELLVEANYVWS